MFSTSAFAQGNTITVVNPDGTKTSIDIGETPAETAPPVATPPRIVTVDPAPAPKPVKKSEPKPVKKQAVKKQATKKTSPAKKQSAKTAPVKKDTASKKKKAVPAKKSAQKKSVKPQKTPVEPAMSSVPATPHTAAAQPAQRLGEQMTSDDAIRIALDVAPPARAVHAVPVNYKGYHAYQVIFATEDGERSVFVDRETAKIVR